MHHVSKHPSPHDLCLRLDADFQLWLLKHPTKAVDSQASQAGLNERMVMLASTAQAAIRLAEHGLGGGDSMSNFASECEAALKKTRQLRSERVGTVSDKYTLPDLERCIAPGNWVNPSIPVPPACVD